MMNTGFLLPGFPCLGAWVSYGLGRLTDNLPTFVVLPDPRACRTTRTATSPPASCRSQHQGTILNTDARRARSPTWRRAASAKFVTPEAETRRARRCSSS